MLLLFLSAGGVAGTLARYGLTAWVHSWAATGFPWGTLAVNLIGSFLLGFFARLMQIAPLSLEVRGMLTVGFCGAFTTFSTLSYETVVLLQQGAWSRAAAYAFGSVAFGLLAVFAGLSLASTIARSPS